MNPVRREDQKSIEYESMTEEQKREFDIENFKNDLNKQKPYFVSIPQQIDPIVEALDDLEQSIIRPPDSEMSVEEGEDMDTDTLSKKKSSRRKSTIKGKDSDGSYSAEESGEESMEEEQTEKKVEGDDGEATGEEGEGDATEGSEKGSEKIVKSEQLNSCENSEEMTDEEPEQIANEQEYIELASRKPDFFKVSKMKKLHFATKFEDAQAIMVNFQYETDHDHILKKLIGLIPVIKPSTQCIILGMPPNATFVDTHVAEQFQKHFYLKTNSQTILLFVRHEDKALLLTYLFNQHGFRKATSKVVKISGRLVPDTLLYSWGSVKNGKLGLSDNYHQDFVERNLLSNVYKLDTNDTVACQKVEDEITKNPNLELEEEEIRDILLFESVKVFTPKPQPIVSLLGVKIKQVECGTDHVLALTDSDEVYSWGANERGQLGKERVSSEKEVEFSFISYEDASSEAGLNSDRHVEIIASNSELLDDKSEALSMEDSEDSSSSLRDSSEKEYVPVPKIFQCDQKRIIKTYEGIPRKVQKLNSKVERVSCGSSTSFAFV